MKNGQFNVFGKTQKSTKLFPFQQIKESTNTDKYGSKSVVTLSYKIKFIDSSRFMATSLSNRADNLTDGIHKIKCKDCDCFIEYESVKENLIKYKCLSCNKNYTNTIDEELKKRFKSTFKVSNNAIKKLIFLLRKGVYSYEYMDDWKKVGERTSP